MDKRILRSLATCALFPYLSETSKSLVHDGVGDPNGAQFPSHVAAQVLEISHDPMIAHSLFIHGFEFALGLASLITQNPSQSPDLEALIAEANELIEESMRECA